MGKTFQTGKLVNGFSVDDSGNVTIAATTYLGSSASSRIEAASNIIRGFFSTESTPRFSIGRDVFANGQAGISLGSGTAYAGIGVNTTGDGAGNVLYFSLNATSSTALNSNVYATLTTSGLSVTGTGSFTASSGGVLSVTSNSFTSSGFLNHSSFMAPNMTGGGLSIGFGKSNGTYNLAKIVYNHVGNASSSNSIGLGFWDADNKMIIRADGNVGIGTTSPANYFTTTLTIDGSSSQGIMFRASGVDRGYVYQDGSFIQVGSNTGGVIFKSNDTERMRITSAGRVGIGTTTPGYLMELSASSAAVGVGIIINDTNGKSFSIRSDANNFYIRDNTASSDRMIVTSDGRVGVGSTPASGIKLDVFGNMALNDYQFRIRGGSDPNHALTINSAIDGPFLYGYQGAALGYSSSGNYLRVIWTVTTNAYNYNNSTTWQQTSDIRVKQNLRPITGALDKICGLNPTHFEYKHKAGETKTGFIAQEFEQVFPGHVSETKPMAEFAQFFEDGEMIKTIDADLIPYLVKSIQELKTEIDILKNK